MRSATFRNPTIVREEVGAGGAKVPGEFTPRVAECATPVGARPRIWQAFHHAVLAASADESSRLRSWLSVAPVRSLVGVCPPCSSAAEGGRDLVAVITAGSPQLTLTAIGTGDAFSRRYGTTCSMLRLSGQRQWLIDCGRQAPEQLASAGIGWHEIDGQLITHVHGDHVFGLEEFALVRYYQGGGSVAAIREGGERPRLIAHDAVLAELWEVMAPTLRYRTGSDGQPAVGQLSDYFEVRGPRAEQPAAMGPWPRAQSFRVDEVDIVARETQHVTGKPSTSFEIAIPDGSGRAAWWSGDSTVNANLLAELAPRLTVFFHDCTFTRSLGQVHGAFADLAALPEQIRRRMVLMHHADDVADFRSRAEAAGFRLCMPGDVFDLISGQRLTG